MRTFIMIHRDERGGARVKLIAFLALLVILAYAGYMYLPVAFDAYYLKDFMQTKVDQAAVQGYDPSWVTDQLSRAKPDFHVPDNAVITPAQKEDRLEVRVQFTRPIKFPGYTYNYEFDHTARSGTFLTGK